MKQFLPFFAIVCCLCVNAQQGTEIYLFDMKARNGNITLSNGTNITNRKGYDNQPYFHPSKPLLYYTAANDSGKTDIRYFDYVRKVGDAFTQTPESEYSPTVTPDGNHISCIIQRANGKQDLGKYPISGTGGAEILVNNLTVGYHAWADKNKLLLFVLGDSGRHTLHFYDLVSKRDTIIATRIGRSLHKIPGEKELSFVQRVTDKRSVITSFDPGTMETSPICDALPGVERDLAWVNDHTIIMSLSNALLFYKVNGDSGWQPVSIDGDGSMLKGITRLAVNKSGNKLAVVVNEQ